MSARRTLFITFWQGQLGFWDLEVLKSSRLKWDDWVTGCLFSLPWSMDPGDVCHFIAAPEYRSEAKAFLKHD